MYIIAILIGVVGDGIDGHAYWALEWPRPYPDTYGLLADGFNYSPAIAQAILPFAGLPWPLFHSLLEAASLAALYYLVGRWSVLFLLFPPVAIELFAANVNLVVAATIVVGFAHPAAWAFPILTKVAPGIGVLWFPLRREWRSFAIALAATGAIVAVSVALAPSVWVEWVTYMRSKRRWPAAPECNRNPIIYGACRSPSPSWSSPRSRTGAGSCLLPACWPPQ